MKKLGLLVMPLMTISFLVNCNKGGGDTPTKDTYHFKFTGSYCKIGNQYTYEEEIAKDEIKTFTIVIDEGYTLSDFDVNITGNATYQAKTITINKMDSDVTINATAKEIIEYQVTFKGNNCKASGGTQKVPSSNWTISRTSDLDVLELMISADSYQYRLPTDISVLFNEIEEGVLDRDYKYNQKEGKLTLLRQEEVSITIDAIDNISVIMEVNVEAAERISMSCTKETTIDVNWGDGKIERDVFNHTYDNSGSYTITMVGELKSFKLHSPNNISISCLEIDSDIPIMEFKDSRGLVKFICKNLTSIGDTVFISCPKLEKCKFDHHLTSIGFEAFNTCPLLSIVDLTDFSSTDKIPLLDEKVFDDCSPNLHFYVKDEDTKESFMNSPSWIPYAELFTTSPIPSI